MPKKIVNKTKKPFYKKWWTWAIVGVIVLSVGGGDEPSTIETSRVAEVELAVVSNTEVASVSTESVMVNQEIKPSSVHFIDTGNSDAILILDNGKSMLIDGADNNDEELLTSYLSSLGVKKLDYVVLTHPDADHSGGLDAIVKSVDVDNVLIGNGSADTETYKSFVNACVEKGLTPSVPLDEEFALGAGKVKFYNQKSIAKNVNDRSLVMTYTFGEKKLLFMGDAGVEVEKLLPLDEIGDVDLIKVGHHGSKTSTSTDLIKKVKPEIAVITSGKDNQYGHPNQEVLDRLSDIKTYRTDLNGNIILTVEKEKVEIQTQKDEKPVVVTEPKEEVSKNAVYTTETGGKYHTSNCRTLKKSKIETTLDKAKARGLTPCGVCKP